MDEGKTWGIVLGSSFSERTIFQPGSEISDIRISENSPMEG